MIAIVALLCSSYSGINPTRILLILGEGFNNLSLTAEGRALYFKNLNLTAEGRALYVQNLSLMAEE
jgi:hypothetical protein